MPHVGDKLYKVVNGLLEKVILIKKEERYTCRLIWKDEVTKNKVIEDFQCGADEYCLSEVEAWKRYIDEQKTAIQETEKKLSDLKDELCRASLQVYKVS